MSSVENRYINDAAFHKVVDQMRALLSMYFITPSEMREAACLASSMHNLENIKPLIMYMDEAKFITPAMFGDLQGCGVLSRTASGSKFGTMSGRFQSSVPNFTEQDKQAGLDKSKWGVSMVGENPNKYTCICRYTGTNSDLHSQTCKDYNWAVTHPKPEHCHTFSASGNGYDVCLDCGISDVYYNWAYNRFGKESTCLSPTKTVCS